MGAYKQFSNYERAKVEEGLNQALSFRTIAKMIRRQASTVSREVKANRSTLKGRGKRTVCTEKSFCRLRELCAVCGHDKRYCQHCTEYDCRELCEGYLSKAACPNLSGAPWVCNGCKKRSCGCTRPLRFEYRAQIADTLSGERRSEVRSGVDMCPERFNANIKIIQDGLGRGLSPYEICAAYKDTLTISEATVYRWVERGYGGMTNMELERKVGFKPREHHKPSKQTHHGAMRSYEAFCALSDDERDAAAEMDTVIGKATDRQSILTLYPRPTHFQLFTLLATHTPEDVVRALDDLERILGLPLFKELFGLLLTDNGIEFKDCDLIERSITSPGQKRCRVYYCDPRQSQQKPGCEKNHSELRQLLPKPSVISFDELVGQDIACANSHVNSNPRRSIAGLSPIAMLKAAYGKRVDCLFEAYGIEEIRRDRLTLRPDAINSSRKERGEDPLKF